MKLSIIVPVFNEEKTIKEIIRRVRNVKLTGISREIIIVDDGSSDKTPKIINKIKLNDVKKVFHKRNKGKGAAVSTGIQHATGDYILVQDADLEYDPRFIPRLVRPIVKKKVVVVYGTRLKRLPNFSKEEQTPQFLLHYVGNRSLSLLVSICYGQWITDMETGYKLFPRNAVRKLKFRAKSFDIEPEITARLTKQGYKITEIPIRANPRGYKDGKKLRTFYDGFHALRTILKHRFIND